MKKTLQLFAVTGSLFFLTVSPLQSQVTIGAGIEPVRAALLDLKDNDPDGDNVTSKTGGLVLARVKLENINTLQPFIPDTDPDWTNGTKQAELKEAHVGLVVYNLTEDNVFSKGAYVWDGEKWITFAEASIPPEPLNQMGTVNPTTANDQDSYLGAKLAVGNDLSDLSKFPVLDRVAAEVFNDGTSSTKAQLTVIGPASINGMNVGIGSGTESTVLGVNAMSTGKGSYNVAVGYGANQNNTDGSRNTAVGRNALWKNTKGAYNTAVGMNALEMNEEASQNTAVGYYALQKNTTGATNSATEGVSNTAMGYNALSDNTTGSYNVALGAGTLDFNSTGSSNTAVGLGALYQNRTGDANTAVGQNALNTNQTGHHNTAVGQFAGYSNVSNIYNTYVGDSAGYHMRGNYNTFLGHLSGKGQTQGVNNIAIGSSTGLNSLTGSNQLNIGNAIYGVTFTDTDPFGRISIGKKVPDTNMYLDVKTPGTLASPAPGFKLVDGNQADKRVLTSDANGVATWAALPPTATTEPLYMMGSNPAAPSTSNSTASYLKAKLAVGASLDVSAGKNPAASIFGGSNNAQLTVVGPASIDGMNVAVRGTESMALGVNALNAITTAGYNTAVGRNTLQSVTTGGVNTAVGNDALKNDLTGGSNVAVGSGALSTNTTGSSNTVVGTGAMLNNINGGFNTAIGESALAANGTTLLSSGQGGYNTAVGYTSLSGNTTGSSNTAIGNGAGSSVVTGNHNIAIGNNVQLPYNAEADNTKNSNQLNIGNAIYGKTSPSAAGGGKISIGSTTPASVFGGTNNAQLTVVGPASIDGMNVGKGNGSNSTAVGAGALNKSAGAENTAVGSGALFGNTDGIGNTAVGSSVLGTNKKGGYNTAVGVNAGAGLMENPTTGTASSRNVFLGYNAGVTQISGSNNIAIGSDVGLFSTTGSNQLNIGDAIFARGLGTADLRVGIGEYAPTGVRLFVEGLTQLTSLKYTKSPGDGYVLKSDGEGNAIWAPLPAAPVTGAENGVKLESSKVKLGGKLTEETTINNNNQTLTINGPGTTSIANDVVHIGAGDGRTVRIAAPGSNKGKVLTAVDDAGTAKWVKVVPYTATTNRSDVKIKNISGAMITVRGTALVYNTTGWVNEKANVVLQATGNSRCVSGILPLGSGWSESTFINYGLGVNQTLIWSVDLNPGGDLLIAVRDGTQGRDYWGHVHLDWYALESSAGDLGTPDSP